MPIPPAALEPVMLAASSGLTAMVAALIWWGSGRAGLSSAQRIAAWLVAMFILVTWQIGGHTLARAGAFINEPGRVGPGLIVAVVLPVIVGLAGIASSSTARRIAAATPVGALVAIQVYRVVGAVFLALWLANQLPGSFALPAGLGDIAIGLAAPIVGFVASRRPDAVDVVRWWNMLGIADLVIAVTTGFLTSPGTAQLLAIDAPNRLITAYPLALVPLYAVPVSFILHGIVWHRLRAERHYAAAIAC